MTRNKLFKPLIFNAFLISLCTATWAASLELGQVRANRRGWVNQEVRSNTSSPAENVETDEEPDRVMESDSSSNFEDVEVSAYPVSAEVANPSVPEKAKKPEKRMKVNRFRGLKKLGSGLELIGGVLKKNPSLRDGYLAVDVPPALRFSDLDPVNDRPPSPALPEFNFVSNEYMPYLIETHLSEDELNNAAMLSEMVIEMPPHEVISGKIETRRKAQEEMVEHFDLDEHRSTVLRPEEVLIYFETDTNAGKTGAMVPFSPATPTSTTIKSTATLTKE